MTLIIFHFILTVLATWRVSHLLSKEDGPFDMIYLLRKRAGTGFCGSLLDCFYCVSIWLALPLGLCFGMSLWEKLLYWWAISGAACLLEQATTINKNNGPDIPDYKED